MNNKDEIRQKTEDKFKKKSVNIERSKVHTKSIRSRGHIIITVVENYRVISLQGYLVSNVFYAHVVALSEKMASTIQYGYRN